MQHLIFALIPLAGGFLSVNKNEPISRNSNHYPGPFHVNRSNAAHPGRCESGWTYYDETDACYKIPSSLRNSGCFKHLSYVQVLMASIFFKRLAFHKMQFCLVSQSLCQ
ncbi:unnamed protein product [Cylicocyclus nassatus]|uniref:Uncharacterized protein n=1 Tax=Cylicocyclus nassatus TaxID=53992 RepID=A0AA36H080_CYLNA|nr:unnamed protein product [Cylicocyclus nassatus]